MLQSIQQDLTRQQRVLGDLDAREKAGETVPPEEREQAEEDLAELQKRLYEEIHRHEKIKREAEAALAR